MRGRLPVLIVGAGPAGSATALRLARAGVEVVLIDRVDLPRRKACGACANPGTVGELRALGVAERIEALDPGRLRGWELRTRGGRSLRADFGGEARCWVIDRTRLDAALLREARDAGARFEPGVSFSGVVGAPTGDRARGDPVRVRLRHRDGGEELRELRLLVGADGLHSRVRREVERLRGGRSGSRERGRGRDRTGRRLRKVGLSLHLEGVDLDPARGRLLLDPAGTIGLAPLDPAGGRWTLVRVTPAGAGAPERDPGRLLRACATAIPEVGGARVLGAPLGSGLYDQPVAQPWAGGILLAGDAAGYYDPVTGQGIGRALRSARGAAEAILAGGGAREMAGYANDLRRDQREGIRVQRIIEGVLRRPALLERLLPALAESRLLDDLVRVTGDLAPPHTLWSPGSWPRWGRTLLSAILSRG